LGIVDQAHLAIGPEGDIYVTHFGGGDFAVHYSADGGASFKAPDHSTGQGLAFGVGTWSFASSPFPNNDFRINVVRAIAADPIRPGQVYAAEAIQVADAAGD